MNLTWRDATLGSVCISKPQYGFTASASEQPIGPRFLRTTDIVSGRIDWEQVPYCEIDGGERQKYLLKPGDLLVSRMGTVGVSASVDSVQDAVFASYLVRFTPDPSVVFPGYLKYVVQSPAWWKYVRSVKTGSVQPNLNAQLMSKYLFALPPLEEQRRIAGVLGALDDLIEVDRRLVRDQLDLARAAFSREANEANDCLALGDLYSAGLSGVWGNDEAGGSATEEVAVLRGRDLEDVWVVNPAHAPRRFLTAKQVASRHPEVGEIWTAGSGSLGPSLAITEELPRLFGQSTVLYSNFVKRLIPTVDASYFGAAWLSMIDLWQAGGFENFRTGTAMPNLDTDALLRGVEVPNLSLKSRALINRLVRSALDPALRDEMAQLGAVRDELLPLLMSGRVRVSDVAA